MENEQHEFKLQCPYQARHRTIGLTVIDSELDDFVFDAAVYEFAYLDFPVASTKIKTSCRNE
jgi:hypothetical protein